jgi:hypothetical protein
MPLQNRVTPMGDIVASPERGLFTGNRGIIHDAQTRTLLKRRWTNRAWLICTLRWRDVRRTVMGSGSWTEMFFLDEATALAAGHRPCFLCRREAALAFQRAFPIDGRPAKPKAPDMDLALHAERLDDRQKRLHALVLPTADLPDGVMVLQGGVPHLVVQGMARAWSMRGYGAAVALESGAQLITPPSTMAALEAGYRPHLHASACDDRSARAPLLPDPPSTGPRGQSRRAH